MEYGELLNERYLIEKRLCNGGMSSLYLAKDTRFDKIVVVKQPDYSSNFEKEEYNSYLKSEAQILAKLDHPNLVKVTDFVDGEYLVMDYVAGESLEYKIREFGKQRREEVIDWSFQIADALNYLHSRNPPVIHRDVKPANCILTSEGTIKLVDFGIAKYFDPYTTKTGIGTFVFAAPEIISKQKSKPTALNSDVYSLGITMLALLIGEDIPHPAEQKLRELKEKDVPKDLVDIVEKCLLPADSRYSAKGLYDALREISAGEKVYSLPVSSVPNIVKNAEEKVEEMMSASKEDVEEIKGEERINDKYASYLEDLIKKIDLTEFQFISEGADSYFYACHYANVQTKIKLAKEFYARLHGEYGSDIKHPIRRLFDLYSEKETRGVLTELGRLQGIYGHLSDIFKHIIRRESMTLPAMLLCLESELSIEQNFFYKKSKDILSEFRDFFSRPPLPKNHHVYDSLVHLAKHIAYETYLTADDSYICFDLEKIIFKIKENRNEIDKSSQIILELEDACGLINKKLQDYGKQFLQSQELKEAEQPSKIIQLPQVYHQQKKPFLKPISESPVLNFLADVIKTGPWGELS